MTGFVAGNKITLLHTGAEYFPALEEAFDRAQNAIYLEAYIYANDATGRRISAALARAAGRGVAVHLLLDGFGSKDLPEAVLRSLGSAGVKVLKFRPERSLFRPARSRLHRLHRKIAVVDEKVAFVGGINIIDDVDTPGDTAPRYDYAVVVEGPLVEAIRASVRRLWSLLAWAHFKQRWIRENLPEVPPAPAGSMRAAFVVRDNIRHRRDIEAAYLRAIRRAKSEIILANPYFLPGHHFRHALLDAAARGVRVALLLQGRIEYPLPYYAARALYGVFLDAGIEIHEYHRSVMHAKVAVVDGRWATVGSSNIDPFSLLLSREANVIVRDRVFAATLRDSLAQAMQEDARRVIPGNWAQQPLYLRSMSWAYYGVARLLMGMVGYGREKGY